MNSSRYESAHGATRSLTAAQKLAEIACERIAHKQGSVLIARFWQSPQWRRPYADQVRFATSLLKVYPEEVVFRALRKANQVWSLNAPFFVEYLDKELKIYEFELGRMKTAVSLPPRTTVGLPRSGSPRTGSVRGRLNKLDAKKDSEGGNTQ
jgi:hypothetical protein